MNTMPAFVFKAGYNWVELLYASSGPQAVNSKLLSLLHNGKKCLYCVSMSFSCIPIAMVPPCTMFPQCRVNTGFSLLMD